MKRQQNKPNIINSSSDIRFDGKPNLFALGSCRMCKGAEHKHEFMMVVLYHKSRLSPKLLSP